MSGCTGQGMRESLKMQLAVITLIVALLASVTEARGKKDTQVGGRHRQEVKQMKNWQRRNANKSAAHLIGIGQTKGSTLKWESKDYLAFTQHKVEYDDTKLVVHRAGLYYVYCQVGFHGKESINDLTNKVYLFHDSYPEATVLLAGTESVVAPSQGSKKWYSSLGQGGLARLEEGHLLYVNVSHPGLVDYRNGKTFFGLLMVS
ncbi:lymphotoxin-beta [Bombina bombina]|uniref:lymphotoxin-beta n=1 Tax=Bombina bombina TaxID=8345 RepID=UPI00235B0545|nr:lymphotoxin-beta [Bombina bombina]